MSTLYWDILYLVFGDFFFLFFQRTDSISDPDVGPIERTALWVGGFVVVVRFF